MQVKQNCFEKTKVRWGIFKKLSPTKLHLEQSAPLAANVLRLCVCLPLAQCFKLPQMLMGQIAQNRCYKLAADY